MLDSLKRTLSYLRGLAGNLPDPDLSQALDQKVGGVMKDLSHGVRSTHTLED